MVETRDYVEQMLKSPGSFQSLAMYCHSRISDFMLLSSFATWEALEAMPRPLSLGA
jgi:hypothetical protein